MLDVLFDLLPINDKVARPLVIIMFVWSVTITIIHFKGAFDRDQFDNLMKTVNDALDVEIIKKLNKLCELYFAHPIDSIVEKLKDIIIKLETILRIVGKVKDTISSLDGLEDIQDRLKRIEHNQSRNDDDIDRDIGELRDMIRSLEQKIDSLK